MLTYRDLTTGARRALDRFLRAGEAADPITRWPELTTQSIEALLRGGLIEPAGQDARGATLFRVTDEGCRVHDEMWKDGKVPHHPVSLPYEEM